MMQKDFEKKNFNGQIVEWLLIGVLLHPTALVQIPTQNLFPPFFPLDNYTST